ncbi:MAG TPA: UDP-3-O-acyl-N-acetylglucosamine deacetylase [Stellaceae bacterium]|jgi:UDP-3-O-[3-hydroxymyristoyl] N-acetylglucosamine deacetylase|nr:UDP-3-O-acyl-N-acetylglucosamine deacetylase [Stellaceae bacterium]
MRKTGTSVQHTIKSPIYCRGIGLHSGRVVTMTLRPAAVDSGIVFRRVDLDPVVDLPALWSNAMASPLCTTLRNDEGVTVSTIEHLMAALHAGGIDNIVVELDAAEVPILDGSADPFLFLIDCAGPMAQTRTRRSIEVRKTIRVEAGESWAEITPDARLSIQCDIDFASHAIGRQSTDIVVAAQGFRDEIARARTFGFLHEVEQMRAAGLARGGSLDNAIVVDGDTVLNEEGLRFDDEFVRHKTLDIIGDLYLAGAPLLGRVRAHRPSHALTYKLLTQLFADAEAWRYHPAVELDGESADDQPLSWVEPVAALSA